MEQAQKFSPLESPMADTRGPSHIISPDQANTQLNPLTYPIYDKVRTYTTAYDLKSEGLYFYMRKLESSSDARIQVNGREMLRFGSNNYLGLTTHPRVKEAFAKALEKYGVGAGSVRLLGGTFGIHEELEQRLAQFKGTEAAVVFSS